MGKYNITARDIPTFYFIGVTTVESSIMDVFPLWIRELGRPEVIVEGVDLRIYDTSEAYRFAVAQIKYDLFSLGALMITHQTDLYRASQDMFDYFDPYAEITGEISSISKRTNRLEGHAKDWIPAGLSMDHIIAPNYFARTGDHALIFGAGGFSISTVLHLINEQAKRDRSDVFATTKPSGSLIDRAKASCWLLIEVTGFVAGHHLVPSIFTFEEVRQ